MYLFQNSGGKFAPGGELGKRAHPNTAKRRRKRPKKNPQNPSRRSRTFTNPFKPSLMLQISVSVSGPAAISVSPSRGGRRERRGFVQIRKSPQKFTAVLKALGQSRDRAPPCSARLVLIYPLIKLMGRLIKAPFGRAGRVSEFQTPSSNPFTTPILGVFIKISLSWGSHSQKCSA